MEDAEKRRDYLATYDGTIYANGTHTVIGTVLVEHLISSWQHSKKNLNKKSLMH